MTNPARRRQVEQIHIDAFILSIAIKRAAQYRKEHLSGDGGTGWSLWLSEEQAALRRLVRLAKRGGKK